MNDGSGPTARHVSPFDFPIALQLAAIDFPESPGEQRDRDSGKRREGRGNIVQEFLNRPERDRNYVVGGALFIAGLCVLTYLALRGEA